MSQYIIKECLNDGWSYEEKSQFPRGIYQQEREIFERALLSLFCNGDLMKEWNNAETIQDKKKVINKALLMEIDNIKENLRYDLEKNIKIYPLIKRKIEAQK